jgi:ATP synthase F1 complex assembly factor 2
MFLYSTPLIPLGFEKAVMNSKSFLISLALFENEITVEEAAYASRVESIAQSKRWGELEASHDLDEVDMKRQLGSAATVLLCNRTKLS